MNRHGDTFHGPDLAGQADDEEDSREKADDARRADIEGWHETLYDALCDAGDKVYALIWSFPPAVLAAFEAIWDEGPDYETMTDKYLKRAIDKGMTGDDVRAAITGKAEPEYPRFAVTYACAGPMWEVRVDGQWVAAYTEPADALAEMRRLQKEAGE